jgi:hypothetical protein
MADPVQTDTCEFGIKAEWHFYAPVHGNGVCDGLGGTVKRLAAKASIQRPYKEQILTAFQLFTWCESNIKSAELFFFTGEHTKGKHDGESTFYSRREGRLVQRTTSDIY